MYRDPKKIHLIGIGGIGVSGIAELLLRNGYKVSGSDAARNDIVRRLEGLGIPVSIGHDAKNIQGADLVVYSSAVKPNNPERVEAKRNHIPAIPRAEMLAELMRLKSGIAVAGAHGKTTTTSLIALVLMQAGLDPTIVVGGRMDNFGGTNARLGTGDFMVVEADESDGSFTQLSPAIAIVTNMDREHMDHYQTLFRLKKAFVSFLNRVPFYGLSIYCGDDPLLRLIQHRLERRKKTYGFENENDYQITSLETKRESTARIKIGSEHETIRLQVPGRHNLLNSLAALAVADEVGVPRKISLEALASYKGVERRFQRRGQIDGVVFVDDYAHHPSEIIATLRAAQDVFPHSKFRAIFQPHRFTRVKDLFEPFGACFTGCTNVAITPIYAAGEVPIEGISSTALVEQIKKSGIENAQLTANPLQTIREWLKESSSGDVILTLGAGDLPNVYKDLF